MKPDLSINYAIDIVKTSEYIKVVDVWEASVRATHYFLSEQDIQHFKPLILNEYLAAVELRCIRGQDDVILGFLGVADLKIEMLFVDPRAMKQGIGKMLTIHAIDNMAARQVDVNEDNMQAVGFYEHLGFKVMSRSRLDALGKPFPILHMLLND